MEKWKVLYCTRDKGPPTTRRMARRKSPW